MTTRDTKLEEPSPDDASVSIKQEKQLDYFKREDKKEGIASSLDTECEPKTAEDDTKDKTTPEIRTNKDESEEGSGSCPGSSTSGFKALKKCHHEGCGETTERSKVKTWLCKKHRNKLYKDTYKKKKNELPGGLASEMLLDNLTEGSAEVDAPVRQCTMLEQVLNEKKLALLQSPEVQEFFRQQQQELRSSHHVDAT